MRCTDRKTDVSVNIYIFIEPGLELEVSDFYRHNRQFVSHFMLITYYIITMSSMYAINRKHGINKHCSFIIQILILSSSLTPFRFFKCDPFISLTKRATFVVSSTDDFKNEQCLFSNIVLNYLFYECYI